MGFKGTRGEYMPWSDAELEYFRRGESIGSIGGMAMPLVSRRGDGPDMMPVPAGGGGITRPLVQPAPLVAPLPTPQAQRGASETENIQDSKQRNKPNPTGIPNSSKIESKDPMGKTTKYSTYDKNGKLVKQVEADRGDQAWSTWSN